MSVRTDKNGNKRYYNKNKELHREGGPAIEINKKVKKIYVQGYRGIIEKPLEVWCENGKIHREDGPAVITKEKEEWFLNGIRHRLNGPAIKFNNGSEYWYKDGELHRRSGPAYIAKYEYFNKDTHKIWFVDGQKHRLDGPAEIWYCKGKIVNIGRYFIKGVVLTKKEHDVCVNNKLTFQQIQTEQNIEKRRLFLEFYGLEKYIFDSNAILISKDRFGSLYICPLVGEEAMLYVQLKNSTPEADGSYKNYFLRVPPFVRTPKEAVAWSFDMQTHEYNPLVQT